MKLGQLIEYNMRNIFLKKLYTKCGIETSPRLFSGKFQQSKALYSLFLLYPKLKAIEIYFDSLQLRIQ